MYRRMSFVDLGYFLYSRLFMFLLTMIYAKLKSLPNDLTVKM